MFREAGRRYGAVPISFTGPDSALESSVAGVVGTGEALAARLLMMGIGPGEAVVVQLANSFECLVAYAATALAGATLVPVPASYGLHQLLQIVGLCGARLVLADQRRASGRELVAG